MRAGPPDGMRLAPADPFIGAAGKVRDRARCAWSSPLAGFSGGSFRRGARQGEGRGGAECRKRRDPRPKRGAGPRSESGPSVDWQVSNRIVTLGPSPTVQRGVEGDGPTRRSPPRLRAVEAPSGAQYPIETGRIRAVITEVGATLRELVVDGEPVLWGFPETAMCSGGRGQVLAPWPNRLEDGAYTYAGASAQAPLDEPERHNAIHGLVRWRPWQRVGGDRASVELACELFPQPGYPFRLHLALRYALDEVGLHVEVRAENRDRRTLPFGIGFHPYLLAPTQGLAGARLVVPATRHLELDGRGLPVGEEGLDGDLAALASSEGADLGPLRLDDCFTGLLRGGDGTAAVRFLPRPGREVSLVLDEAFAYLMCFTGDSLPPEDRRRAVALEPMTCPPNALRSGRDLVELGSGEVFAAGFLVAPSS